jgi:hypothetical protein
VTAPVSPLAAVIAEMRAARDESRSTWDLVGWIDSLEAIAASTLRVKEAKARLAASEAERKVKDMQWTLDNIFTLARREVNKDDPYGRWGHVLRLCERVGCKGRGVLRGDL